VKSLFSVSAFSEAEAQYEHCIIFLYVVNFDSINNPHLM
jgi:hypothetical protein